MISVGNSRKPWRHFHKKRYSVQIIRKICYGALILEAALLIRDFKMAQFNVVREESHETQLIEEGEKGDWEEIDLLEEYFGIRFRVKEGILELYRREVSHRLSEP